jgi:outer membrane receptor protein involved in Fe transport
MHRTSLFLSCLLLGTLSPLVGQEATFVGVVADSLTGDPLAGAFVSIVGQDMTLVTGMNGRFALAGVGSGDVTVEIRRPGFRAGSVLFEITVNRAVTVDLGTIVLSPLVVELDPVVVEGTEVDRKLNRVGFFQRMSTEQGTFLTGDEIERQNPRNTSELVRRIPGFQVGSGGMVSSRRGVPGMSQGFSTCDIEYYIDGVHADGSRVDDVLPNAIVAMEVYTGAATIPPAFRVSGNAKCGVVVIWTRTGGRRPTGE